MRSLALLLGTCAAFALLLLPGSAFAAPTDAPEPSVTARATELFRAGRAAAAAGDDKTACERFGESEKLQPAPGTELNLGACESKQGHLRAAREHYRSAAAGFGPEDLRRAVAVNSANGLTDRLGLLTLRVAPGAPADATVTLNGVALDAKTLAQPIEVDPGKTTVVVNAASRQPRSVDVQLAEGEKKELAVDAGDAVAPETPAAPPVDTSPKPDATRGLERTLGFVGVGAGVAGIAVGSIFGALALHEASVVKANCNLTTYACQSPGVSAASTGSTDGIVSTVGFIAGGVLAAAGVYLVVRTWGPSPSSHAKPIALTLTPLTLRSGGGAVGTWTF